MHSTKFFWMIRRAVDWGLALLTASASAFATEYIYPPSARPLVIDITQAPYFADNTGQEDVTAVLQQAIREHRYDDADDPVSGTGDQNFPDVVRVLYFPDGTYLVSDMIVGADMPFPYGRGRIQLRGQSRDGVILKLKDHCDGTSYTDPSGQSIPVTGDFSNPAAPLPVLSYLEGGGTNNAFGNYLENLTIDVGSGNPGAIGAFFFCNNHGAVRDVLFRSSDPGGAGAIGLDLSRDDDTPNGAGLIRNVEVQGFDIGISFDHSAQAHPWVLEDITLSGQHSAGIVNRHHPLAIRRLQSSGDVPALRLTGAAGHTTVLDSSFTGGSGAGTHPAIDRQAGWLFVRNSTQTGYRALIDNAGADITDDLSADEFFSGSVLKLWPATPSTSLNLPVPETPDIPWETDPAKWMVVDGSLQNDDTAALQAALNTPGITHVAIVPGTLNISNTVTIGPEIRRIIGNYSRLYANRAIQPLSIPLFRLGPSSHGAVVLEGFDGVFNTGDLDAQYYLIEHDSNADLVLKDLEFVGSVFRNTSGATGRLFVENVHSGVAHLNAIEVSVNQPAYRLSHGMEMYARQLNPERQYPLVENDGGTLWVFGAKFGEQRGPVVTRNGGNSELMACLQNVTSDSAPADTPQLLVIDNANVSAMLIERAALIGEPGEGWGMHEDLVVETRGGETRTLRRSDGLAPIRANERGSVLPLYVGYSKGTTVGTATPVISEDAGTVPQAFTVSRGTMDVAEEVTVNYTLSGSAAAGSDYAFLSGQVTLAPGASEAHIPLTLIDDTLSEGPETLTLTLQPGPGYELGSLVTATLTLEDNDTLSPGTLTLTLPPDITHAVPVTLANPLGTPEAITLDYPRGAADLRDSRTDPGVNYVWIDIAATGSEVISNNPIAYMRDDGRSGHLPIGFPFPWHNQTHSAINISGNGFLTTFNDTGTGYFSNDHLIPGHPLENMMAVLWDDLKSGDGIGRIFWQSFSSAQLQAQHPDAWAEYGSAVFVVQWDRIRHYENEQRVTFQAVLQSNGQLNFVYQDIDGAEAAYSYTVGYQFGEGSSSDGELISFFRPDVTANIFRPNYVASLTRLLIEQEPNWLDVDSSAFTVPPGSQSTFQVSLDTTALPLGTHSAEIIIASDRPGQSELRLPVLLTVADIPAPPSDLTLSLPSLTRAELTWTDQALNETTYLVERRHAEESAWTLLTDSLPANSSSYSDPNYDNTRETFYRVRALNANGESPDIAPVSSLLPPRADAPVVVGDLTLDSTLSASYSYSDPNGDPEAGSLISWLRSDSFGGPFTLISGASDPSYTLQQADLGSYIAFRVVPVSNASPSSGSEVLSPPAGPVSSGLPPAAPSGLSVTVSGPRAADLRWSDQSEFEAEFRVERSADGFTWEPVATLPANSNAFLDSTLQPGTHVQYRVLAANVYGASTPTPSAHAVTPPPLLAYEGFEYPDSAPLGVAAGGFGWNGPWGSAGGENGIVTGTSSVDITSGSMVLPAGAGGIPRGNTAGNASSGVQAVRMLEYPIDLGRDGSTWFSFTVSTTGTGSFARAFLGFYDALSTANTVFDVGLWQGSAYIREGGTTVPGTTYSGGVSQFLIGKIVHSASGEDRIHLKRYSAADSLSGEPVLWDAEHSFSSSARLNRITLEYSNNQDFFDEIRIGDDFASVTGSLPWTFAYWLDQQGLGGPEDDSDGNGLAPLVEYAFHLNPGDPRPGFLQVRPDPSGGAPSILLQFLLRGDTRDLVYKIESSADLGNWDTANPVWRSDLPNTEALIDRTDHGDGTETLRLLPPDMPDSGPAAFWRLTVETL